MTNKRLLLIPFFLAVAACSGEPTVDESSYAAKKDRGRGHEGDPCGGPVDRACRGDLYCAEDLAGICPGFDFQRGVCAARPDVCITFDDPVCGCDGMTYTNDCTAAQAGAAIAYDGACEVPSTTCATNDDCTATTYCQYADDMCGWGNPVGTCVDRPTTCEDEYTPACGCDGLTYGNACDAAASGASLQTMHNCLFSF